MDTLKLSFSDNQRQNSEFYSFLQNQLNTKKYYNKEFLLIKLGIRNFC